MPNPAVSSLNIFDIYFFLVAEGILPLCGLYITEGILSVREDATTFWVTAEGIQPLSGLQQRGYGHSLGYRWDIQKDRQYPLCCNPESGIIHSMET